jgi:hypothetical protein
MANSKKSGQSTAAPETPKFTEVENQVFRKALQLAGGYPQLGSALGVSRQSVHKWTEIPERFAPRIEELYGIPRAKVAPRLYKGLPRK